MTPRSIPAEAHRTTPAVSFADLKTILTLAGCAPFAWILGASLLERFCGALGALHTWLRGARGGALSDRAGRCVLPCDAESLERRFMATVYEETCNALREYRPGGWNPKIQVRGLNYVDNALAAGRGAILWICPCSHAELVVKKAFHAQRLPIVNLRSYIHPYSGTRFGKGFLNPVRTRIEDRFLRSTVVLYPDRASSALRQLQLHLRENSVVSIFAIAAGSSHLTVPCLGGELRLALGAPVLAEVSGAAVFPVYVGKHGVDDFTVHVGPSLTDGESEEGTSKHQTLALRFAEFTEQYVERYPFVWRGWLSDSLWRSA